MRYLNTELTHDHKNNVHSFSKILEIQKMCHQFDSPLE